MAIQMHGETIETDEEGFLLDPSEWNEAVAKKIAQNEQLELTAERWLVIKFVRDYYDERQSVPEARAVLKLLGERLGKEKATRRFLQELFPYGYGQQACKIAGMRKPRKLMLDV
jgi:tRNA 2-thiouridine synthesizing protein E